MLHFFNLKSIFLRFLNIKNELQITTIKLIKQKFERASDKRFLVIKVYCKTTVLQR